MFKRILSVVAVASVLATVVFVFDPWSVFARDVTRPWPAAEFTHDAAEDWINSAPIKLADLRGKVIMVDFWTFGCWNCYRSFPWLNALERRRAGEDFMVLGVHTPEFEHEKDRRRIVEKMDEFGLHHFVMIDNDFSYWKAMGNRYWPTFYLIDKQGQVRGIYIGETHEGDRNALEIEAQIDALLNEKI